MGNKLEATHMSPAESTLFNKIGAAREFAIPTNRSRFILHIKVSMAWDWSSAWNVIMILTHASCKACYSWCVSCTQGVCTFLLEHLNICNHVLSRDIIVLSIKQYCTKHGIFSDSKRQMTYPCLPQTPPICAMFVHPWTSQFFFICTAPWRMHTG